ncbi:MAG: hypothetical protein AB7P04_03530 [Bacteriovoracia bacterium]
MTSHVTSLILPFINLSLLVAIILYFTRGHLKTFVKNRHETLREEIQTVREQLKAATERYEQFSAKLKAVEAEVSSLTTQMARDAQDMKARIVTHAKQSSSQMVADARGAARGGLEGLKQEVRSEFGWRVISKAEEILTKKLTGDDRARIRKEFSSQMEQMR